jgi:hypothetical protein
MPGAGRRGTARGTAAPAQDGVLATTHMEKYWEPPP